MLQSIPKQNNLMDHFPKAEQYHDHISTGNCPQPI